MSSENSKTFQLSASGLTLEKEMETWVTLLKLWWKMRTFLGSKKCKLWSAMRSIKLITRRICRCFTPSLRICRRLKEFIGMTLILLESSKNKERKSRTSFGPSQKKKTIEEKSTNSLNTHNPQLSSFQEEVKRKMK